MFYTSAKSNPVKATLFVCCVSPLDRHFFILQCWIFFVKIKNKKSAWERDKDKRLDTDYKGCMVVLRGIL